MWQDWVLMVGSFLFAVALIPTILSKTKPSPLTSLLTFVVLSLFVWVYGTLGLWKAVAAGSLTAIGWMVLLIQGARKR